MRGLMLAALFSVCSVAAQQPKPQFDVASVRVNGSGNLSQIGLEFLPNRFVATMVPLRALIAIAYGGEEREPEMERIVDGPSWVDVVFLDVQGTTGNPTPQGMMRLMLQSLLEERFGLRLMNEQRMMERMRFTWPVVTDVWVHSSNQRRRRIAHN